MSTPEPLPGLNKPNLGKVFIIWFKIGAQSFGGGPSTTFLIRNELIYKLAWLEEEEYARFWILCQLTPGVNLISLTILIGKKLGGAAGILVSLLGMLLPSTFFTILLAACFSAIQSWPPVQSMLKGLTPATAGISLLIAFQFARPLLRRAKKEGPKSLGLSFFIIAAGALVVALLKLPVVVIFICAGLLGAFGFGSKIIRLGHKAG